MNMPPVKSGGSGSDFNRTEAGKLFSSIIAENVSNAAWAWLSEASAKLNDAQALNALFTQVPRKTGKALLSIAESKIATLQTILPGLTSQEWTVDRLCRAFLVLQLDAKSKNTYVTRIENLFTGAEINEQVALYSALPLLAYPDYWALRCAEGIRSNVTDVLESIMYDNPYPARYLEETAWNQMVLKAFFTEKTTERIIGLDDRANPVLAAILLDYAHERWAAQRTVNPLLWRCVGPFINTDNIHDIERVFHSTNLTDVQAAALACSNSLYSPAKRLLAQNNDLTNQIAMGTLTWSCIAEKQFHT